MESAYTKLAVGTALALSEDRHSYETPLYEVVAAPHPSGVHEYAESYTDLYESGDDWKTMDDNTFEKYTQAFSNTLNFNRNTLALPNPDSSVISSDWCNKLYWSRVSTLQELVLPTRALVCWSETCFPVDKLLGAKRWIGRHLKCSLSTDTEILNYSAHCAMRNHLGPFAQSLSSIIRTRETLEYGSDSPLPVANMASSRHCSNRRNYVYGILGLLLALQIKPDYNASVRQVYTDATIALMGYTGNLLSFSRACNGISERDLQSWTPDWSESEEADVSHLVLPNGGHIYAASGSTKAKFRVPDLGHIELDGFLFDSIKKMCLCINDEDITRSWSTYWRTSRAHQMPHMLGIQVVVPFNLRFGVR